MDAPILLAKELSEIGISSIKIHYQLSTSQLIRESISRSEAELSNAGALVVSTGKHTGRSPKDKYIVTTDNTEDIWWGEINHPISIDDYVNLRTHVIDHLNGHELFVQDVKVGSDPNHNIPVRFISTSAWHALFSKNLFIPFQGVNFTGYTVFHAPDCFADPVKHHLRSESFIILNFSTREVLIGGTNYAGEVKKAVFTVMNFHMPANDVLPMHCSANIGNHNDVALYFGLSGTGKTTLSSDPERRLIGDDEHGWSDKGVFNFEGGCYAKTIRLNPDLEPLIWKAVESFGSVLENVCFKPGTFDVDYDNVKLTENTRGAYPLAYIPNRVTPGSGGHPENIFFLSADAFGVLPPISILSPNQAMYYFLSGYTFKLAGTEVGLNKEPQPTFSVCFAAPFLPLDPVVYSKMLLDRIKQHHVNVWLVNTGWTGGAYGVGARIPLPYTRMLIKSALSGDLLKMPRKTEDTFGLDIPISCPGIPEKILQPYENWQHKEYFSSTSARLAAAFKQNIAQYADLIPSEVILSGPH